MKHKITLALILTPLMAFASSENLSPHQRVILESKSPPRIEAKYSFDAPAGPQFTEAEKQSQRERAKDVLPMVRKAFEEGAGEVRIPPGDYRFTPNTAGAPKQNFILCFEDMQRDAGQPFVIDATGATFWFDLSDEQMPPGHYCVGFRNCRNIVFRGATIDRGTRGCIEGRITQIDRAGNRFEIQPSPGIVVPATYKGGIEQRVLPFKSDGRFCAPLYDLQQGIRKLQYKDITPSTAGRYWVNMRDPDLMNRIHDANWEKAYGELGVIRVGDGLSCLYTTATALALEDSANLTMHGIKVYLAKGGPTENGGDGAHLWKDCYFGPRPDTNQWKGGDGFHCRSTRYGTTMDNVTVRHSSDDVQNIHGIWGKVNSVSGNQITLERNSALRPTLKNARPGDRLRFVHRKSGAYLGEAKLTDLKDFVITLDQDATRFAEGQAEWLDQACAGWLIQNCLWEDNFQSFLIMSGPGTLRNCTFIRMGSAVTLNTGMGLVGGIPSDITIANNTFIDVNPRPGMPVISARVYNTTGQQEGIPAIERLVITGNTFVRPSGPAMGLVGIKDSRIAGNLIESPFRATALAKPTDNTARQAILLRLSSSVAVKGNTLKDPDQYTTPDPISRSVMLGLDGTTKIILDDQPLNDSPKRKAEFKAQPAIKKSL